MKKKILIRSFLLALALLFFSVISYSQDRKPIIVIHGGAGNINKADIPDSLELAYKNQIEEALKAGYAIMETGGSSLDAVVAAVVILENSGLFNAGKGAVYNSEGKTELDASLMEGKTLRCGAVAGVMNVKNPILLARNVMEKTRHVFLTGKGAYDFAKKNNLEIVDDSYFYQPAKWQRYQKQQKKNSENNSDKKGTVGAVALDKYGNLAAATSTGGLSYKMYGRVGDSPVIGAGTYASNKSCAVSCTGTGEYFIRTVAAHNVSALMEYANISLNEAVAKTLEKIESLGGDGGLIAVDAKGNIAMKFNTQGMFRGFIDSNKKISISLYKD